MVDESKCVREGICLTECPGHFLELLADEPVPTWVPATEGRCAKCGHCVAICPEGAISLGTMPVEACQPIDHSLLFTPAQVEHQLRARRSVRSYQAHPVPKEVLERLIDIARYAPSGGNSQPVEWLVVHDSALVGQLAQRTLDWVRTFLDRPEPAWVHRWIVERWERGEDIAFRGTAPHLIFVHGAKGSFPANYTIALTYLEIAAPAFGLGACWAGFMWLAANEWPPMREVLCLPEGHECFGAMMMGYPMHEFQRIPLRNAARVTWL